jgi:hypothetical protein
LHSAGILAPLLEQYENHSAKIQPLEWFAVRTALVIKRCRRSAMTFGAPNGDHHDVTRSATRHKLAIQALGRIHLVFLGAKRRATGQSRCG